MGRARGAVGLGALWLLAAGVAVAAVPGTSPQNGIRDNTPELMLFRDARIFVAPGRVLERGSLLVRDGLVVEVGRSVDAPDGATVIELDGKTVYPGFVDPYTDYGLAAEKVEAPRGRGRGGRSPELQSERSGADAWNAAIHAQIDWASRFAPDEKAAEARLAQGFTVVQSARLDGILRGRAFVATLAPGLANDVLLSVDGSHFASFDKGSSTQPYPGSLMGSIALLRQTLLDADWYARAHAAWRRDPARPAPEENLPLAALAAYDGPLVFESEDELSLLRAARIAEELDLELIHVASNREYARIAAVAALGRPLIVPVDFPDTPALKTADDQLDVSLAELRHWERAPGNPAVLERNDVRFAFTAYRRERGSERVGGKGGGSGFLDGVRAAVEHGLSAETALAALTTVPADLIGVGERVGTLEPGKLADFVVADGDLLADDASIVSVWIAGKAVYEPRELDRHEFAGKYELTIDGAAYTLSLEERRGELQGKLERADGSAARKGDDAEDDDDNGDDGDDDNGDDGDDDNGDDGDDDNGDDGDEGSGKADVEVVRRQARRIDLYALLDPLGVERVLRFSLIAGPDGEVTARGVAPDEQPLALEVRSFEVASAEGREGRKGKRGEGQEAEPPGEPISRLTFPNTAYGRDSLPVAENVLVRGATVWTGEAEGILEDADLLVIDGKIAGVGSDLDAPRGVRIIDGAGKHVTAGIIDEHSHIAISRGVNEGSHAVTAEVRIGDVVDPDDIAIYRALAGGVTTAQLLHGSANPIGGQAQVIKLRWGASAEAMKLAAAPPTIKFALGENVKQSNWGDRFTTRYPQTRMGVETIMRDRLLAARDYADAWRDWEALDEAARASALPPRHDLQLEALAEVLASERFVHCHSYVQSEILMLMRLAEELGFRIQTFTHILEGYKVAPEMAAHGAGGSTFSDWWAYKFEVYDAIPYNTCLMHDRGVVTSINSDSSNVIRRLNQEAGKSVMYCGMEQAEAIKLATLNPAIQLRIDDRVGSLAPGKDADFVIWSANPLSMYARAEQTWIDGALQFDLEHDAELRAADHAEKAALVEKALRHGGNGAGGRGPASRRSRVWHCDDVLDVWRTDDR